MASALIKYRRSFLKVKVKSINKILTSVFGIWHIGEDHIRSIEQGDKQVVFLFRTGTRHRCAVYESATFCRTCARYCSQQQQKAADVP